MFTLSVKDRLIVYSFRNLCGLRMKGNLIELAPLDISAYIMLGGCWQGFFLRRGEFILMKFMVEKNAINIVN